MRSRRVVKPPIVANFRHKQLVFDVSADFVDIVYRDRHVAETNNQIDDAHEVIQYHRIILRPTSVVTERPTSVMTERPTSVVTERPKIR